MSVVTEYRVTPNPAECSMCYSASTVEKEGSKRRRSGGVWQFIHAISLDFFHYEQIYNHKQTLCHVIIQCLSNTKRHGEPCFASNIVRGCSCSSLLMMPTTLMSAVLCYSLVLQCPFRLHAIIGIHFRRILLAEHSIDLPNQDRLPKS